jgi:hypothetical protein
MRSAYVKILDVERLRGGAVTAGGDVDGTMTP